MTSKELQSISFYKQYPEYIPFIGSDFAKYRILLLGESHFWDSKHKANHDPEKWYQNNSTNLTDMEKASINTRDIIDNFNLKGKKYKSRRTMFGNIDKALKEAGYSQGIQSVAFMNAFQRPAIGKGKSIKKSISVIDIEKSIQVVNKVIEIIKPKYICFVSKYSYNKISKSVNFKHINAVAHPTCPWWRNKTKKGIIGRELFIKLLKKNE